ncbi:amidase domain-containing protein [Clostridium septicum]|uniref:amidase domain-containing protein n=1 Tax=Clostridium septicum TaxID=1504 RepID=UPI0008314964|nr:amidase domain-containing protein [Clostridium septicum]MDU1312621.1 amidase domain-containing protein [Clostridium septicum]WLF70200.1 amidase domain-containing protein [Clostridium septicum]
MYSIFSFFKRFKIKKNILIQDKSLGEIEKVLMGYFSHCIENEKKLKQKSNKYIYPKSILENYNKVYYSFIIEMYKNIKVKAEFYNIFLNINSINIIGKSIVVDVDKIIEIKYKNSKVKTKYKDNHLIYLNIKNNKLFVSRDIIEEGIKADELVNTISSYEKYMENKINIIKKNKSSLKEYINNFNKRSNPKVQENKKGVYRYSGYDGNLAAKWASENWDAEEEYQGNDCTNFVSKCLKNGGLPMDKIWRPGSYAWIRVVNLRNWLVNTGYGVENKDNSNLSLGDVVQLHSRSKDMWSHSTIITYIDEQGEIYVSAHSYPYYNRPLFSYYPTYAYSNIRYLRIKRG